MQCYYILTEYQLKITLLIQELHKATKIIFYCNVGSKLIDSKQSVS